MSKVNGVEVEVRYDATISVFKNGQTTDWIKPGCSARLSWDSKPSTAELVDALEYLTEGVAQPVLMQLIDLANEKL